MKIFACGVAAAAAIAGASTPASAEVIAGPDLNMVTEGYYDTGLSFKANRDSFLTGFTFHNVEKADTILLTDADGDVLQSLNTPGGIGAYVASVDWALDAGETYWLLQTTFGNADYTPYGMSLPSNDDISIVNLAGFGHSIAEAVAGNAFGPTDYWVAFNDITTATTITGAGGVPEPASWALMILGFGAAGAALRRRVALAA